MKYFFYLLLILISLTAKAEEFKLSQPHGMRSVWVGDNIIHNGIPVKIKKFTSSLPVQGVIDFYKDLWADKATDDRPGYIKNSSGEWEIISQFDGDINIVVQVKASKISESEGFISIAEPFAKKNSVALSRDFPQMSGTKTISSTQSSDFGKSSKTLILSNSFSLDSNISYYKSKMKSAGWSLNHAIKERETAALFFNKNKKTAEIAINKGHSDETFIIANLVTEN